MTINRRHRFFSIHVMKTGGTSVQRQITANFSAGDRYPSTAHQPVAAHKIWPERLRGIPPAERDTFRCFHVHYPAFTADWFEPEVIRMTVVRDPVDRAVSHLRQITRSIESQRGQPIDPESVFDVVEQQEWMFTNHQVRVFGLDATEELDWSTMMLADNRRISSDPVPEDRGIPLAIGLDHLKRAKERLASFDLVGRSDALDTYLGSLEQDFGWTIAPRPPAHVGTGTTISKRLRQRIADANSLDQDLFEFARSL